jgi:hypothetical protein
VKLKVGTLAITPSVKVLAIEVPAEFVAVTE